MFSLHTLKCSSVHVILGQWSITEDLSYKGVHREAYYTNVPQQNVWYQLQATEQKIEKKKKKSNYKNTGIFRSTWTGILFALADVT